MPSRRKFLLMGVAVGGLAAIGGGTAFAVNDRYEGWVRQILHRWLPGYDIDPKGLAQFLDDFNKKQGHAIKLRLFAAAEGVVDVEALLPQGTEADIKEEERRILSSFLVGSDFFETYPNGPKKITYRGRPVACGNPFATF
jgi:hypothetical protein